MTVHSHAQGAFKTDTLLFHFAYNSASVRSADSLMMRDYAKANPSIVGMKIIGHTDGDGNEAFNDSLAMARAKNVQRLVKRGLRLTCGTRIGGKGELAPKASNLTSHGKARNRRVEVIVRAEINRKSILDTNQTFTVGDRVVLDNLNFYGGRHYLLPASIPTLEKLLELLKERPGLHIDIQGHVCCSGGREGLDHDTGTYDLSKNRAEAIYNYLVEQGIEPERLSFKGLGGRFPITQERTEAERTANRRVEFEVTAI